MCSLRFRYGINLPRRNSNQCIQVQMLLRFEMDMKCSDPQKTAIQPMQSFTSCAQMAMRHINTQT